MKKRMKWVVHERNEIKPDVPISAHCCPIFYILDIIGNLKTVLSCNTKYVGVGGVWRKKTPPLYFFSSL